MDITLHKNNVKVSKRVHRLVAEAFLPNPNGLPVVNHKDENPENNAADNLEWCTQKYNCNYGNRTKKIAEIHARPVEQLLNGQLVRVWPSAREAGRAGYKHCSIVQCCNGNASHHRGYQWRWKYQQGGRYHA